MKINYMRRSISFILLAGALLILAACTREADRGNDALQGGHHAYIQEVETRTGFDVHDGKFSWTEGDQIAIYMSDGSWRNTEVDYRTGAFGCETTDACYRVGYAVYPASIVDQENVGDPVLNIILPAEYDIKEDLRSNEAPLPMVAVNSEDESDLYFCHVGGLLRITCNAVPAGTCRIGVTLDRNIAGTFTVSRPESTSPAISSGGSTNTVYFTVSENGLPEKTDGIVLNLPVPTGTYSNLTVTPYDYNGDASGDFDRTLALPVVRQMGKKLRFSLTEVITDSMQLVVTAGDATGWTYTLPFERNTTFPANLVIDWGDDETSEVSAGANVEANSSAITHTYSTAGDHTITITGTREGRGALIPSMHTWNLYWDNGSYQGYDTMLKSVPTPLMRMDSNGSDPFRHCLSLESICANLFSKNPQLTSLNGAFSNCIKIQIPAGLFDCLPNLQYVVETFWMDFWKLFNWGYTSVSGMLSEGIPAGLFDNNPEILSFQFTFYGCDGIPNIPANLFAQNQKNTSFDYTFYGCSGIEGTIPGDFFSNNPEVITFRGVFCECSGLTGSIPAGLFANNPEAQDFSSIFSGCSGLTGSIPENLFASNPEALAFSLTFNGCTGLTGSIPEELFAENKKAEEFYGTFMNCTGLTGSIPEDLFANNTKATNFIYTFGSCPGLSGSIPKDLFSNNPDVTSFSSVFNGCSGLTGSIPVELFANNPDVTSFSSVFGGCSGLTGSIPEDLFANQSEVLYFDGVFAHCSGLTGSIPENLFARQTKVEYFGGTFEYCSGLTGSIPENLFATNPDVVSFSMLFRYCEGLTGEIPAALFANNMKAYNFYETFAGCRSLKIRPDIFLPRDRFSGMDFVDFYRTFESVGYDLAEAGEAPDLWNYPFTGSVRTSNCFNGTNASNYSSIPDEWIQYND